MTKEGKMPDFNNWGFNSQPEQHDVYGLNDYTEPENDFAESNDMGYESAVSDEVEIDNEPSMPTEDEAESVVEESTDEEDGVKGKTKNRPARKTREKTMPHIEEQFGRKLIRLVKSLDDERVVSLAKALTDTKKNSPEAVLDALTEPRNQRRIAEFASAMEGLSEAEPGMIAAEVTLVFAQGKDMTALLFAVLNAIAPEKNFGRPVDDQSPAGMRKNLGKIVNNWGDGVDLSLIDGLRI